MSYLPSKKPVKAAPAARLDRTSGFALMGADDHNAAPDQGRIDRDGRLTAYADGR